ncbi:MAG: hypothetical protein IJ064_05435 [Bacteroidaceae bacterium]|nr:hypothetical protein [Bacteroidaceae bacterium]
MFHQKLLITQGNATTLRIRIVRGENPVDVTGSDDVAVMLKDFSGNDIMPLEFTALSAGGYIDAVLPTDLKIGSYGLEVTGKMNGNPWRVYGASVLAITNQTAQGCETFKVRANTFDVTMILGVSENTPPIITEDVVNDDGTAIRLAYLSQEEYDSLVAKDSNTTYLIFE